MVESNDAQVVHIAVEVKVDSNASRDQLEATTAAPHVGVLLSLSAWTVVGPERWADVLRQTGAADDEMFAPYLAQVERKPTSIDEHANWRATGAARSSGWIIPDVIGTDS